MERGAATKSFQEANQLPDNKMIVTKFKFVNCEPNVLAGKL